MIRKCNKCRSTKLLDEFVKSKRGKDGYTGHCKECEKLRKADCNTKYYQKPTAIRKHRKRMRVWYQNNKKLVTMRNKNRKYLIRSGGSGVTNQQWDSILKKYNHRCAYCGVQGNMTMDHVIPLSRGGKHSPSNVVPACPECNDKKGVKSWQPKILKKVR
jgi:5-methylcytosine-specific restriction endonuclease McrA